MTTTPPAPITKHSEPMLKNWPWTDAELAWVAARDAQWQAYALAARADLEAEVQRLREALQEAAVHIAARWGDSDPHAIKAFTALEKQP